MQPLLLSLGRVRAIAVFIVLGTWLPVEVKKLPIKSCINLRERALSTTPMSGWGKERKKKDKAEREEFPRLAYPR